MAVVIPPPFTEYPLASPLEARRNSVTTTYSVVVPMLDEGAIVNDFGVRLAGVLDELGGRSEVILVDDGSTDGTYAEMLALRARDARFKVIKLSRNFGHQLAITAGLDAATGDAVSVMDGDLQHPPELLTSFVERWREGYDVVYGVMTERDDQSWLKRTTAAAFYRTLRLLTPIKAPSGAGDFRLIDGKALNAFRSLREEHRFIRGMWDWIGFRQIGVPYVPEPRRGGRSKYSLIKMTRLALDGIISFSVVPLRAALGIGACVALASLGFGVWALVARFFDPSLVPGWASLATVTSFVLAVQLMLLGMLGEYVGRIYDEVKCRPLYIVQRRHGLRGVPEPPRIAIAADEDE